MRVKNSNTAGRAFANVLYVEEFGHSTVHGVCVGTNHLKQGDMVIHSTTASNSRLSDLPLIFGDLMRWKLKLPPRPGLTVLNAKLAAQTSSVQVAA